MYDDKLNALNKIGTVLSDANACGIALSHSSQVTVHRAIAKHCREARKSWASTVFNASNDAAVKRYISYEMLQLYRYEQICSASNMDSGITNELANLCRELYDDYRHFLMADTKLPSSLVKSVISALVIRVDFVQQFVKSRIKDRSLTSLIINQLGKIRSLQYHADSCAGEIAYAEIFVQALEQIIRNGQGSCTMEMVTEKLMEINFNNIQFFLYLENLTRELLAGKPINDQLDALRRQKQKYNHLKPEHAYSHKWKPIGEMMSNWISEEITLISDVAQKKNTNTVPSSETLGFNLSVAQLACLTKVFSKAGMYLTNITSVLNWSARYFHSKQQPHISEISFSKQYYSVSQRTAAQVLELLQKMCSIIKNEYFPLLAAISAVHLLI